MFRNSNKSRQAFVKVFKGNKNFLTPKILAYYETDKYYVELSTGSGILRSNAMYGVTVLDRNTLESMYDISRCFHNYQEALNYINNL